MTTRRWIADFSERLFPLVVICPGCAGREIVGHGETEWVCHGRVITTVVATNPHLADRLGPVLEPAA